MNEKLLAVQQEIGTIRKSSTNPYFNSKYFDINALLAEVKPILNKHKLVLLQPLGTTNDNKLALNTILRDVETGQEVTYYCPLPEVPDAQKAGGAITYFRRYALQALLALEAEDDDANVASGKKPKRTVEKKDVVNEDEPPFL